MTERASGGSERQIVCPFLAFGDDREFRSAVPDRRHLCFADSPAAARALAHQAAYCLTGSFTACPTFQDWARRESAPARDEPPARSLRDTPVSPRLAGRAPEGGPEEAAPPARPSREHDWASPPPWGMAARTVGEADEAEAARATIAGEGRPSAGLQEPAPEPEAALEADRPVPAPHPGDVEAPPFLAGRAAGRAATVPPLGDDEAGAGEEEELREEAFPVPGARTADEAARPADFHPAAGSRRAPVGYAGLSGSRRTQAERAVDPEAPAWERPRRIEAYPAIRTRVGLPPIPRLALVAGVVVIAGLALFVAPFLLRGLGGAGDGDSSPSPSVASVAPSAEPTPTPVAEVTPLVYVVKKGDSLSGIAKAHHVTLDQLLKANPKITNPDKIKPGDQVIIPLPLPSEIVDGGGGEITPAP